MCSSWHCEPGALRSSKSSKVWYLGSVPPGTKLHLKGLRWKPHHLIPFAARLSSSSGSSKITFLSLLQLLISLIDFLLLAEVRVGRHKTNWFQILIPLTAEQSRGLPAIDLQSIQTQLMCLRPMGGGPRCSKVCLYTPHSRMMRIPLLYLALIPLPWWMSSGMQQIFSRLCNYFVSTLLLGMLSYLYLQRLCMMLNCSITDRSLIKRAIEWKSNECFKIDYDQL